MKNMASHETITSRVARVSGFLGLQRSTMGVLAMVVLVGSIWILWFFTKTPFGQIMIAVRDNAKRVDYLGFRVPQTKAVIYVFSGAFCGVAGSIYALFQNLISAEDGFHAMTSFIPIMMTMVFRSETKSHDQTKIEVAVDATTARATCRAPSRAATGAGLPMPS